MRIRKVITGKVSMLGCMALFAAGLSCDSDASGRQGGGGDLEADSSSDGSSDGEEADNGDPSEGGENDGESDSAGPQDDASSPEGGGDTGDITDSGNPGGDTQGEVDATDKDTTEFDAGVIDVNADTELGDTSVDGGNGGDSSGGEVVDFDGGAMDDTYLDVGGADQDDPDSTTQDVSEGDTQTGEPKPGDACDKLWAAVCDSKGDVKLICSGTTWQTLDEAGLFACFCDESQQPPVAICAVPGFVGISRAGRRRHR